MDDELLNVPSVVPLFPLPGVVLFPHTLIPLHIFEPRYRTMATDALAGDRTIALALLKPGWEPLYYTPRAPIHATLGIGQIVEHEQLEDGNYNVLVRGVGRAVVLEEVPDYPYRVARVEPVVTYCSASEGRSKRMRNMLVRAIRGNPGLDRKLQKSWLRLLKAPLELGALADLLAAAMPADVELQQCLLDEPDALARGRMLLTQLRALGDMARMQRRSHLPGDRNFN